VVGHEPRPGRRASAQAGRPAAWRAARLACAVLLLALPAVTLAVDEPKPSRSFLPQTAGFSLRVGEELCPYRLFGFYVLPGEVIEIEPVPNAEPGTYHLVAPPGTATPLEQNRWRWTAPQKPGLYHVAVLNPRAQDMIALNVFVLIPFAALKGRPSLNGYRMGAYPSPPLKNASIYAPPKGFIEVTSSNQDTPVGPHFTLRQFLCKQAGGFPKYLALRERLVLKLERILEAANEAGYPASTFNVMSGYRTPYYNQAIGNVKFSRHQWGDAADIFIDERPADGVMDDLNRNGRHDIGDARVFYDLIQELMRNPLLVHYAGGQGLYGPTSAHGPFVHVDVRGYGTRWGI
jgi:hypothetical protein